MAEFGSFAAAQTLTATELNAIGIAWSNYTPTDTNITVGNGTRVAKAITIGKLVYVRWSLVLGSTSAIGSNAAIGLPYAAHASGYQVLTGYMLDSGTRNWVCIGEIDPGASSAALLHTDSAGAGSTNSTSPFTWTTNDRIAVEGVYERA